MRRGVHATIAAAAVLCAVVIGCSATKITDAASMSSALGLTPAQQRSVRPNLDRISAAVEDYEADREAFVESMPARGRGGGDMAGRRAEMQESMRRLRAKRAAYQVVIDNAVQAIADLLDAEQRKQFAGFEKPELLAADAPRRDGARGPGGGRGRGGAVGGLGELGGLDGPGRRPR